MKKRTAAEILLAALLLGGAAYFLFYTEPGRQWLERLKNTAADQLDRWLADLEDHLAELESNGQPNPSLKSPIDT